METLIQWRRWVLCQFGRLTEFLLLWYGKWPLAHRHLCIRVRQPNLVVIYGSSVKLFYAILVSTSYFFANVVDCANSTLAGTWTKTNYFFTNLVGCGDSTTRTWGVPTESSLFGWCPTFYLHYKTFSVRKEIGLDLKLGTAGCEIGNCWVLNWELLGLKLHVLLL